MPEEPSSPDCDRPIRVLRIIARMNVGGPALQTVGLARGIDPARFEQRILAGEVSAGEEDYLALRAPDVAVVHVPGLGRAIRPWDDVRAFVTIRRNIRSFRPDIVHTHTAKAGVLGRLAAWSCRVPFTVHTFHGHLLRGYFSQRVTNVVRIVEAALARRTSRLVAVGAEVRDELLAAGIGRRSQYVVVPPGISEPRPVECASARRSLGLPDDVPVVAFVARLTSVKRPDRFLDAAGAIAAERSDVRFVVAGAGPELGAFTERGRRELGDRLLLLGWRSDVETVYAAADVVVLTSDNEGMPVSLIEAAASGRASVATRVGSVAEVVRDGETGFVVAPEATEIARKVVWLLDHPNERRAMGEAAARRTVEQFGVRRLVGDIEALYTALLEDRSK
jgi:glycosyltransferase involved in cell wall biosynthesis